MTERPEIDGTLMRYLLGQLDAEEQATLDERAFVDDAWEEARGAAADELIEAYLSGALSSEERRLFEVHFLDSAAHRERLRLLRDLRAVLARPAAAVPRSPRATPWLAAAAALLAVLAGFALLGRRRDAGPPIAVATPEPAATAATSAVVPTPTVPPPVPTRTVRVAVVDAAHAATVPVASDVRTVRFEIEVADADAPSYSVALRQGRRTLWHRDDLVPEDEGAPVVVDVPADVLTADEAVLSLEPEATRDASPGAAARTWRLRIVRR